MTQLSIGLLLAVTSSALAADPDKPTQTEAPGPGALPSDLQRLIAQLGSNDFQMRERAGAKLSEIGWRALPALRVAVTHQDAEIRARATRLIVLIDGRESEKAALRKLLTRLLTSARLSDAQRIEAFYLVCMARAPTEQERQDAEKHVVQVENSSAKIQGYFDVLLHHRDFKSDCGQIYLHVLRIEHNVQRGFQKPPPGAALNFGNDKTTTKLISAAAEILAKSKVRLTKEQRVNVLFLMTLYRFPDVKERKQIGDWVRKDQSAQEALGDFLWALLNSKECVDRIRQNTNR